MWRPIRWASLLRNEPVRQRFCGPLQSSPLLQQPTWSGKRMSHYLGSASIDRLNKLYASCKLAQPSASIRCLTIAKGAGHGRLRAQLNVYHFAPGKSQVPPYYAISYTWGDPNGKLPLLINGIRLWISANAHKALMDVRSEHEDRVVWIDALCIDQDNETERNAQVAVMRKIYSHATGMSVPFCLYAVFKLGPGFEFF